jgi:putative hydrolase of the HAD superfamily
MDHAEEQKLIARIRALSSPLRPRPTTQKAAADPLPGIRAVLFDVYGTLVVSASGDIGLAGEQDEASAFRQALAAAGLEAPPQTGPDALKDVIRRFHARRREADVEFPEVDIRAVWREVLSEETQDARRPEMAADPGLEGYVPALSSEQTAAAAGNSRIARLAVEYECRVNPVWPMPGLQEVLAHITGSGLVLGLVSNAQFYTPLMLQAFLDRALSELGFDLDCCAFSYRLLEAKPSVRIYHRALAGLAGRHGISPGEILYVGNDIRNDIWPAALTGCRTALFAGDQRSLRLRRGDPCCAGVVPDRVITDLRQITDSILPA